MGGGEVSLTNLCHCFQVRGHHVAKLDPLGISSVNFDDAPVIVGPPNVGEDSCTKFVTFFFFSSLLSLLFFFSPPFLFLYLFYVVPLYFLCPLALPSSHLFYSILPNLPDLLLFIVLVLLFFSPLPFHNPLLAPLLYIDPWAPCCPA